MRTGCALLLACAAGPVLLAQSSGRFQLVRSVSGSKGAQEGGRFLIQDPRVVFQAGVDRQIMVLFEWQGTAGRHHCEGRWKDPAGNVAFTSASDVDATGPRFGVYWGLSIPDTVATGTWVLEAVIDGEPAGVHAFQILAEAAPDAAPLRRALSVGEIYQRGLASTLTLEVVDATGVRLANTSGFFLTPELVSTSFAGIGGARTVRLVTPEGRRLETSAVAGWDVRDDWALLRFPGAGAQPVTLAPEPPRVGDRAYLLDSQGGTGRVIVESAFIGSSGRGNFRLNEMTGPASLGSPIFNEYGEVVAALAGSGVLGADLSDVYSLADAGYPVDARGSRARVPVSTQEAAAARSLADLDEAGLFVRPLARSRHLVQGALDTEVRKDGNMPLIHERKARFSRAEKQCAVSVQWVPDDKEDTTGHFELFDSNGRRLGATDPEKLKLRRGRPFVQYWQIPLAQLPPGLYRVDYSVGGEPVWRDFFYLVE